MFKDYCEGEVSFSELYSFSPNKSGVQEAISKRSFSAKSREILVEALESQYSNVESFEDSLAHANLKNLKENNTYTVTTGQQLHPFLGPIMVFNKIEAAIQVAKEFGLVPVFWMASEDHDFEEVKSFRFLGREYVWDSKETGPVGRFSNDGLVQLLFIFYN